MHKYLAPKKYKWEGPNADFTPESDDLPWSLQPDHKITIEDIKYLMSSYYQGTKFNPYGKHGDLSSAGKYRPIGVNRNDFVTLTHIRPYVPDEIKSLEWIAVGSCAFNVFIPQYARVDDSPSYLRDVPNHLMVYLQLALEDLENYLCQFGPLQAQIYYFYGLYFAQDSYPFYLDNLVFWLYDQGNWNYMDFWVQIFLIDMVFYVIKIIY